MKGWARVIGAGLLAACALVGFAAAFGVTTVAETGFAQTTTTTTTDPPPPTEPPVEPPPPVPAPIAFGVTVGGVKVGGLMPERAAIVVARSFERPLVLVASADERFTLAPRALGARPNVPKAIRRARVARPGATVPLDVAVERARVRGYADRLAKKLDRKAVDAKVVLQRLKPKAIPAQVGRRLARVVTIRAIRAALALNARTPMRLRFAFKRPEVRSVKLDEAIVIMRDSKKLLFFDNAKYKRWFPIATGQSAYPTPVGEYEITTLQRNPWWYPPPSGWAKDADPVPPGPGNPLGTRWMGISAPYVGIHGTPDAASIGYSASHGCVRMKIPDAEWLFRRVKIGTPVFIIAR